MNTTKKVLKKIDIFGVPFFFKYENEDKFSSSLGGLIFILFCIFIMIMLIYSSIPFIHRKNYSLIYYSFSMSTTEAIKLDESETAFAIGLDCTVDKDGTKAGDLLDMQFFFITYTKDNTGKRTKDIESLSTHLCTYEDFYNKFNESFDYLALNKFYCFDKNNRILSGIYTDRLFTYFQFTVQTKNDSVEHFRKIDDYLLKNDCKFQFYYTDSNFDFTDYSQPLQPYINCLFLQLSPILFLKTNIFFMNQYFNDDKLLIFDEGETNRNIKTLFSRTEDYSLYKGLDRGTIKHSDYKYYANIYIRADTKKTEIKRKYQKLTDFYAGFSSLFSAIFTVLNVFFSFVNNFYAEFSIITNIFYFKNIGNNKFDIFKNQERLKKIIYLTSSSERKNLKECLETTDKENLINFKQMEEFKALENNDINKKYKTNDDSSKKLEISKNGVRKLSLKNSKQKYSFLTKKKKENIEGASQIVQMISFRNNLINKNSENILNVKPNNLIEKDDKKEKQDLKTKKINFSYNIFEAIISLFLRCFMTKNLKLKDNLTLSAKNILYNKLDVISYVRKMILIDGMYKFLIDDNKADVINFLSMPKISLNTKEECDLNTVYLDNYEANFDKFCDKISELAQKETLEKKVKKLILLSNQELKKLIN